MDQQQKRYLFFLLFVVLLTGLVDIVGLASFIPVISAIGDEKMLAEGTKLGGIKEYLGYTENRRFIVFLLGISVIFFVIRFAFIISSNYILNRFFYKVSEQLSFRLHSLYMHMPFESFKRLEESKVIRELAINPQRFTSFIMVPLFYIISESVVMLILFFGIITVNYQVFLCIVLTVIPISYFFYQMFKGKLQRYGKRQDEITQQLLEDASVSVRGIVDIKLWNKEMHSVDNFQGKFQELNKINNIASLLQLATPKIYEIATVLGLVSIYVYTTFVLEQAAMEFIFLFALAGYRVIPSISKISGAFLTLSQHNYVLEHFSSLGKIEAETIQDVTSDNISPIDLDRLEAKDVSFSFQDAKTHTIHGLNLKVKRGEVVGFIGESGSGKTTIVNLLVGLFRPVSGQILVNGTELNESLRLPYRNIVSYVEQAPFIFKGTLESNIALNDEAIDLERMKEAIRFSQLEKLVGDRNPSEVLISSMGSNLSGGQKQRVAIARALYKKSQVIVLDEATSALDVKTEHAINETIEVLKQLNKTIIVIAHRYSSLKQCDVIYEIDKGKIVDALTYSKLSK